MNKKCKENKLRNIFFIALVISVPFNLLIISCEGGLMEAIEKDIAVGYPKMVILINGSELTGNSYDFHEQVLDSPKTVNVVIRNTGDVTLIFEDPQYTLEPEPGEEGIFAIQDFNAFAIQAGAFISFSLDFTPDNEMGYSALIKIYSNDPDKAQYSFTVAGTGYVPADGLFYINNNDSYANSTTVSLNMNFPTDPVLMRFSNTSGGLSSAIWEPYSEDRLNWPLESGADGSRTVYAQFQDPLGFVSDKQDSISLDTIAPTGSITSVNGSDIYTTSRTVTLNVTSSDSYSGVESMRFVSSNTLSAPTFPADSTGWSDFTTSPSFEISAATASGDGIKYIYGQFKDTADNISTILIWNSITLDTVAPSGSISVNGGTTYATSRSVSLTLFSSDATSGVANMRFMDSGSSTQPDMSAIPWKPYSTSSSYNITSSNDGNKFVFAQYQDNAGKISTATISDSITLDTTDPYGTFNINNNKSFTNTTKVRIYTSGIIGATQMKFTGNISSTVDWKTFAAYQDVILSTGEDLKTITGYFRDSAGNEYTTSDQINLNVFSSSYQSTSTYFGMEGSSVAISPDGKIVAVGVPYLTWLEMLPGNVMLWRTQVGGMLMFRKNSGIWSGDGGILHKGQNYGRFGFSVSVDYLGTYVMVGAPDDGATSSTLYGRAFVYKNNGISTWDPVKTITGSSSYNDMGEKVYLSFYGYYRDNNYVRRDGGSSIASTSHGYVMRDFDGSSYPNPYIAVGAPYISSSQGRVYVYDQNLASPTTAVPNDVAANQRFGYTVALSNDGNTLVSGDDLTNVYIFQKSGSTWVQKQKIVRPGDAGLGFGDSVDVSSDGTTVIIGCPSYLSSRGAVYIYVQNPATGLWEMVQRYSPSDSSIGAFGASVAICDDGSTIVVGAPTNAIDDTDDCTFILE